MEYGSQWEKIGREGDQVLNTETFRLQVPGGWLYRVVMDLPLGKDSRQFLFTVSFVPSPARLEPTKSHFRPK